MHRLKKVIDEIQDIAAAAELAHRIATAVELEGTDAPQLQLCTCELLAALADLTEAVEVATDRVVGSARRQQITWEHIGSALRMSRQGAYARFQGPTTTATTRTRRPRARTTGRGTNA